MVWEGCLEPASSVWGDFVKGVGRLSGKYGDAVWSVWGRLSGECGDVVWIVGRLTEGYGGGCLEGLGMLTAGCGKADWRVWDGCL